MVVDLLDFESSLVPAPVYVLIGSTCWCYQALGIRMGCIYVCVYIYIYIYTAAGAWFLFGYSDIRDGNPKTCTLNPEM